MLSRYASINGKVCLGTQTDSVPGSARVSEIIENTHAAALGTYPRERMVEALTHLLEGLKVHATQTYPNSSNSAVISVPSAFSRCELALIADAARKAGINVLCFLSCGCASALAQAATASLRTGGEKLLLFDLGASKLEVTIADSRICSDPSKTLDSVILIEILAIRSQLGAGTDAIDEQVIRFLIREFENQNRPSIHLDAQALRRFHDAAEQVRMYISLTGSAILNLPLIQTQDTADTKIVCRYCGSPDISRCGFRYNAYGVARRFRCNERLRKFSVKYTDAGESCPSEMAWLIAEIGMVLTRLEDLIERLSMWGKQ